MISKRRKVCQVDICNKPTAHTFGRVMIDAMLIQVFKCLSDGDHRNFALVCRATSKSGSPVHRPQSWSTTRSINLDALLFDASAASTTTTPDGVISQLSRLLTHKLILRQSAKSVESDKSSRKLLPPNIGQCKLHTLVLSGIKWLPKGYLDFIVGARLKTVEFIQSGQVVRHLIDSLNESDELNMPSVTTLRVDGGGGPFAVASLMEKMPNLTELSYRNTGSSLKEQSASNSKLSSLVASSRLIKLSLQSASYEYRFFDGPIRETLQHLEYDGRVVFMSAQRIPELSPLNCLRELRTLRLKSWNPKYNECLVNLVHLARITLDYCSLPDLIGLVSIPQVNQIFVTIWKQYAKAANTTRMQSSLLKASGATTIKQFVQPAGVRYLLCGGTRRRPLWIDIC